jgi:hypothetical protein
LADEEAAGNYTLVFGEVESSRTLRTLQAADIAGIMAFGVHAKDAAARSFYEHYDFIAPPTDP